MNNQKLDAAIKEVCPIDGVSIGLPGDKSTWRIDFATNATALQKAAAMVVLQQFDPNAPDSPPPVQPQIDKLVDLLEQKGVVTAEEKTALFQGPGPVK